jgi:hypothetical protein
MEEGEERGLAERAAMAIKARVGRSLAGGDGALNVAARLPPTEAVALYDFVAEHPDDLGLPKGTVVVLTEAAGEKDTARHGQAQHDGIDPPISHTHTPHAFFQLLRAMACLRAFKYRSDGDWILLLDLNS